MHTGNEAKTAKIIFGLFVEFIPVDLKFSLVNVNIKLKSKIELTCNFKPGIFFFMFSMNAISADVSAKANACFCRVLRLDWMSA